MEPSAREPRPIQTRLGLWDTASIIVGIIIGVGIFKTPSSVFSYASGPWAALALWGLAGLLSLVGAFCFAELASTYPRSGGEYVYLTRAYGPRMGFLFAWAQLAVIRTGGSTAAVAYLFAYYAGKFWGFDSDAHPLAVAALAALAIAVLSLVNILGVRLGKRTQNLLTVSKVAGLVVILLAGFLWARPGRPTVHEGTLVQAGEGRVVLRGPDGATADVAVSPKAEVVVTVDANRKNSATKKDWRLAELRPGLQVTVVTSPGQAGVEKVRVRASSTSGLAALALALVLVLWTYSGWHEGAYVAAEVENRRRNLPLALILGTGAVILLYLLVNLAYLTGLGYEAAADSSTVAADVLGLLPWTYGEQAMALLVMVSALGAINGMIFTSSRIYSEMGADHRLFAPLARWSWRWGTPVRSLVIQAVICIAMVAVVGIYFEGLDGFDTLVKCSSPVFCLFFLLTGVALIVLRLKEPHVERPFVTPAYPLFPLVFCAFWGFMLFGSIAYAPVEAAVGLGILLLGLPLYLLSQGWRAVEKKEERVPVPTLTRDEGKQLTQC
jgi:basic amino acid/polyamine antiporter, APA family